METEMDTSAWEMRGRTPLAVKGLSSVIMDTRAWWQVEAALEERVRFETFLAELSSMFGRGTDDAVPTYIQDGLQRVVEFLGIDRSTLLEFSRDQTHLHAIRSYAVPGIPPYPAHTLDHFPWFIDTLRSGKIVCFTRLDELPAEVWAEQESCRRTSCQSGLTIPLLIAGEVRYAITFRSFRSECTWPAELIPRLRLVGEIFANAMSRKHSAEAIYRLQEELAHSTRVTILGESAATLAHELARPLAAILSNAQAAQRFLIMESPQLREVQEALGDVVNDTRRAAELLQRLRALAKKTDPKRTVFDMHEMICEVIRLVGGEASARQISLTPQLQADLRHVCGDRIQLQQVVLNLILNAIEAITEAPHGPRQIVVHTRHEPPTTLTISVQDSGIGLDADVLHRIFDPFFSTKADGIGMGLAISRSIIITHQGRIWATPGPDRGLIVSFSIPTGTRTRSTRRRHERA
jgi:signal transduction histidine kinase